MIYFIIKKVILINKKYFIFVKMDKLIQSGGLQLGTGIILIMSLVIGGRLTANKESFTEIESDLSMPINKDSPESGTPLFLNFYKKMGTDFRLFEMIKRFGMNNLQPAWNGVYTDDKTRSLYTTQKMTPIIIVPGIGATPIFAKWNRESSASVKSLDPSGDFEKSDVWSCNQVQTTWDKIWGPVLEGIESNCWGENTKVTPNKNKIINSEGVITTTNEFGSLEFLSDDYMETLIKALKSKGHTEGNNLYGAGYDFRKIGSVDEINEWCLKLTKLIEISCSDQGNKAIIIGHDLGSVISNYFLVGRKQEWKDKYIKSFITVSGTFGGCPKAIRTLLSGSKESKVFNDTVKNFSGLSLMLPDPDIYGDNPLVHLNGVSYSSRDIPKLIKNVSEEALSIYNICKEVRSKSMKAPGVPVYTLCGDNINTESSYKYNNSLTDNPKKNYPYYQVDSPESRTYNYPDYFVGDGTMPKFALEYPIFWTKNQKEPIFFQFFEAAEHTDILSMYEPIKYLLSVL
jgi:lysophospholipase-3